MSYICDRCKSVFDENDIIDRVVDCHPYGESYALEYGCCCPECGSPEITEAFKCSMCGEYFPISERHWHPSEDSPLCNNCFKEAENEADIMAAEAYRDGLKDDYLMGLADDYPYRGITDPFKLLDKMIGA